MYPTITIHSKNVASVLHRHPWIFSGGIAGIEEGVEHGSLVRVVDPGGKMLGVGTYSATSSIAIRVFDFSDAVIDRAWFAKKMREADARRALLGFGPGTDTTGYRVVFGESDGIPGLVVDRFGEGIVFQLATAGLDALRTEVVEALREVFAPRVLVERSDLPSRKEEKLDERVEMISFTTGPIGQVMKPVEFKEHGLRFVADTLNGQKTGFFLDQRDTRKVIQQLAKNRRVLNLFSYTGAAGVAAMAGGAQSVHHIDSSERALAGCLEHAKLNSIDPSVFTTEQADIFQWLGAHTEATHDMVILDPPALIKSSRDMEEGKKAYHFLNRAAMRLVVDGGIFVTSSCSHYLSEEDLAFTLRRASVQAGASLSVLSIIRQSADHPLSIYFPEGSYLKTSVCQLRR